MRTDAILEATATLSTSTSTSTSENWVAPTLAIKPPASAAGDLVQLVG